MGENLSHFDEHGHSRMVDVAGKPETHRMARASVLVHMQPLTAALIRDRGSRKGEVMEVARLAGIMGAKATGNLIPLCHTLPLTSVRIDFSWVSESVLRIESRVEAVARTGVEMEAITAAATTALTVYDMAKAVDRGMRITELQLEEKRGGTRGPYVRASRD